jgi:hypothetical protein
LNDPSVAETAMSTATQSRAAPRRAPLVISLPDNEKGCLSTAGEQAIDLGAGQSNL